MNRMAQSTKRKNTVTLDLTINGKKVEVSEGVTVLEAALSAGIYIPTLCYDPDLQPYGACRLCIVEIEGMGGLVSSCTTPARNGMVVHTESLKVNQARKIALELILANHHGDCLTCAKNQRCELQKVAGYLGIEQESITRLRKGTKTLSIDKSHPAFDLDRDKCILCGICVRACQEIAAVGAIDLAFRGHETKISTFGDKLIKDSICVSCGECVSRCPTGALIPRDYKQPTHHIKTICPYCGVGCSIYLGIRDEKIVEVLGVKESPVNHGGLCVKGRYGLDFANHPERLTRPLIRRDEAEKGTWHGDISHAFREADWDEALERVHQRLLQSLELYGSNGIGVLSSAKCTNEDNYIIQKFTRAILKTNNVDHCARLCHASTVAGALAAFGDGAMSNSIADIDRADVLFVMGSNTTECHPIIGRRIKKAVKFGGAQLIVADPRSIELSDIAKIHLNHLPGTDVALLNGMMRYIVKQDLMDRRFIEKFCEDYEPFLTSLEPYTLEMVEGIAGIPEDKIRKAADLFGKAKRAIILYGMGITQHTTGTDNVKAIANLLMLTGNMGRPGTGFSPLRGQNNVQGACDMGALPNVFPGYQRVDNPHVRTRFEQVWGVFLEEHPGRTLTELFRDAYDGSIKAMYIVGENPMLSEADIKHVREGLAKLEFLVVQDLFLTETAQMADVVLPAAGFVEKDGTFTSTERRVQLVRKGIDPPGEARADWEIFTELAGRFGYKWSYRSSADIMDEIASLTPIYGGIHHDRLNGEGLQWPCRSRRHKGTSILHRGRFTRGKGKFHIVHDQPPAELPSGAFPILLTTGRILEHWHTGSMSHRSRVLEALAPESRVEISPADADRMGVEDGDIISLRSRRGSVKTRAIKTRRVRTGQAFMPFHWGDAPANALTNSVVDPLAKIPEYKISTVKAILEVLERAAEDNAFLSALAENPSGVLKSYDLTPEHKKALATGDISSIEKWVGPLDGRLQIWLKDRLAKETW